MPARQSGGLPASHAGLPLKPGMAKNVSPTTRRSSMRSAGASGTQGAGLAGTKDAATTNMPEVENFGPPAWRSVLNSKADLGWPDFYPSRPGFDQPEDVLTEENVRNGFVAKTYLSLPMESFSMHGPVFKFLCTGGLDMLMRVGQEVIEQRDNEMPQLHERAYRLPVRVTYNEPRKLQWLADASNPALPLHRLMRDRLPHGWKGVEALDAVFSPPSLPLTPAQRAAGQAVKINESFPIDRAVWFLRTLGANEVVGHRARQFPASVMTSATSPAAPAGTPGSTGPGTVPAGLGMTATAPNLQSSSEWYTIEFTSVYTTWLREQLGKLLLPGIDTIRTPAAGSLKVPGGSKGPGGVLGDESSRTRWLQKWEYSCALLKALHEEHLISPRIILSWLSDQLSSCNLAQLGFVLQLLGDYLDEAIKHLSLARAIIRAQCQRIKEIAASPVAAPLAKIDHLLRSQIRALASADLDVLLNPVLWRLHADLILTLCANVADMAGIQALRDRSEKMLYSLTAKESRSSPRRNQMDELSKLDSISGETDMTELCKSFFDAGASPTADTIDEAKLEDKVFMVLNWSMGLRNLGIHRPYGAYTLLRVWAELREEFLEHRHMVLRRNSHARPASFVPDLFPVLYKWLDTAPAAKKPRNVQAIGITFGEFTRQGLFSYSRYMQTLIAYGQTARARPNGPRSHHLDLLQAMPIFVEANDLLKQRRMALSGDMKQQREQDERVEQDAIAAFKEECKEYVPELYGFKTYGRSAEYKNEIDHQMASTVDMTRFVFLQARFELAENSEKRLKKSGKTSSMTSSAFVRVIQILHLCQGYSSIADFLMRALRLNNDFSILRCIIDTLRRHADVFTAMDRWGRLTGALLDKFYKLDRRDLYHPRICRLLLDLAAAGRVGEEDAAEVRGYLAFHRDEWLASVPAGNDATPTLPAVSSMIQSADMELAIQLGKDMYSRHGPFDAWDKQWWETIANALNSVASTGNDKRLESAIRTAGAHIDQVTEHLALELDAVMIAWLGTLNRKRQVEHLGANGWLMRLILVLITRRRLSIVTILDHLLYPLWEHLAPVAMNQSTYLSEAQLQAVESSITIMDQLFLTLPPNRSLPPLDQEEALIAQTSRAEVFTNPRTPDLIRHLPLLVVLGSSSNVPDDIRNHVGRFFADLSLIPAFKTAIFRHLPLLKDAFLTSDWSRPGIGPEIEQGLVETLKGMMREGNSSDTRRNSFQSLASLSAAGTRLSAWRWTSIVLEMRVEFKRLANQINNSAGAPAASARDQLRTLIGDSLNKQTSVDDADLLCETFRGIDTVVKIEILVVGLDLLGGLLRQIEAADQKEDVARAERGVGFVLRVIDAAGSAATSTDSTVQAAKLRLIDALASGFTAVGRLIRETDDTSLPPDVMQTAPEPGVALRVLLELLRFTLGLGVQEHGPVVVGLGGLANLGVLQRQGQEFVRLVTAILRILLVLYKADGILTNQLQDMLVYVIDVAPSSARSGIHTAIITESASPGFHAALRFLPGLEYTIPSSSTDRNLHVHSTTAGGDISLPLDERPWEMFQYLAPLPTRKKHGDQFLASKTYPDHAAIPVKLFNPLIKRDALPGKGTRGGISMEDEEDAEDEGWLQYVAERDLGDGSAGHPIAGRYLATDAYAGPDDLDGLDSNHIAMAASTAGGTSLRDMIDLSRMSPSNASTASSVPLAQAQPRRQSTRIAMHASSGTGTGTNNDPIAIDDDGHAPDTRAAATNKGAVTVKAEVATKANRQGEETDDESSESSSSSEEEEGTRRKPPAKRPRVAGKAPVKRTGGKAPAKAPARKTVSGKAVARKGGKSIKGVRR